MSKENRIIHEMLSGIHKVAVFLYEMTY